MRPRTNNLTWATKNIRSRTEQREDLWSFIEEHTGHPALVAFASELIEEYDVPARGEAQLARAVQSFVQNEIKFFREYPERWVSPLRTLQWRIGDCDDMSILIATVLRSFRIPVRLKFVRLTMPSGKRFSHVYPQAKLTIAGRPRWVALEAVRPRPLGYDLAEDLSSRGVPCEVEIVGDK
jgi:transglutaminase-like putative cysteine protease